MITKKILPVFAFLFLIGIVFALSTGSLTVDSCSVISGTVTINNCAGLNTSDDSQDVVINKNAVLGTVMSNPVTANSYSNVRLTFRHGGQTNINGTVGVTFYDTSNSTDFCTQDTSKSNSSSFVTDTITACTPSGGWTQTKLNNLGVKYKNLSSTNKKMYLSYAKIDYDYTTTFLTNLNVGSCSVVSGTVNIGDCSGLNTQANTDDVNITNGGVLGLTMTDSSDLGTIYSVKIRLNHSGDANINGSLGITLFDQNSSTNFCNKSNQISNTSSYSLGTHTACTPAGGWTFAKLNNLEVRISNDSNSSFQAYIDYAIVDVNYNA